MTEIEIYKQIVQKQDELIQNTVSISAAFCNEPKWRIKLKKELASLRKQLEKAQETEYLNECIEKATPNLSKIKDIDKELAEIRGERETCANCKHDSHSLQHYCYGCLNYDKWKPIKTE